MPNIFLIAVLLAALIFEFINGFHDTANAIATTVYTRALTLRWAIIMSATMNFIGALTSEKVAMTIAAGLVDIKLELYVVFAALMGAIIWDLFTWWCSIPSSSSHALIGSLIGATCIFTGTCNHIRWAGVLQKVVIPLFTSPLIGMALGFVFMRLVFELFADWTPRKANGLFHRLQVLSAAFMAYSHGNNDAQKTMGYGCWQCPASYQCALGRGSQDNCGLVCYTTSNDCTRCHRWMRHGIGAWRVRR